jgi:hypothetical protein
VGERNGFVRLHTRGRETCCRCFHSKALKEGAMNTETNRPEDGKTADHSDNEKSKLPERDDENRKQGPNDRPGKQSGEGEAPVG